MNRNKIAVGIDIGTHHVKVLVAESFLHNDRYQPRIIGRGYVESKGLRHGYITNQSDATRSILEAVRQAEKTSGHKIKNALVSTGGIGLNGIVSQGTIAITRADSEITDLDTTKALDVCENEIPSALSLNRKVIHAIPLQYKIDGKHVLGKPNGMKGMKLEAKTLFITTYEKHLNDTIDAIEEAGVEVLDVMASPIAASFVTLSKTQKIAGCVLANIGAETVSIIVFENNSPISLEVFPIGSNDITNDIALGFKIPLEEAEQLKLNGVIGSTYPKKKLDEIISARLSDIFELIENHLKKIGKNGLLPAGIIITGGGSGLQTIEELAKLSLKLPSRVADLHFTDTKNTPARDSTWSVAYGLCIIGLTSEDGSSLGFQRIAKKTRNSVISWLKQFLP